MKGLLLCTLSCLFLFGCEKEVTDNSPADKTELNVPYGSSAEQKMDIYLPANGSSSTTKVMILIHGGGWSGGDKSELTVFVDTLKKRLPGYAIFNINYRLATNASTTFPMQENDVKAAIEFIYNKRAEYKITDKFALIGTSAGGHLALLHAYKYSSPVKIKAVVDFFGPVDLVDGYNNPPNPLVPNLLTSVTGGTPTTHATIYQQSSPINFVTAQSSPTIILHGGADFVVSPSQSLALSNKLQTFGVAQQYVFYPTESHGWVGTNLSDSFEKLTAFLNTHVN